MKITKTQAKQLAIKYNINLEIIKFEEWQYGLNIELEHGKKFGAITNITNDNLDLTTRIVIAHLTEFPDYYKRLQKMESAADLYWIKHNKDKQNIFIET